jgi:hypothetical protein
MKPVGLILLLIGLLSTAGCVSERIEPEHSPRVTTAQNSEGLVTLSWKSELGYDYRIFFLNADTRQWHQMPGSKVYRGTGDVITIQDRRNPRLPLPWYSVRADKH